MIARRSLQEEISKNRRRKVEANQGKRLSTPTTDGRPRTRNRKRGSVMRRHGVRGRRLPLPREKLGGRGKARRDLADCLRMPFTIQIADGSRIRGRETIRPVAEDRAGNRGPIASDKALRNGRDGTACHPRIFYPALGCAYYRADYRNEDAGSEENKSI